MKKLKVGILFGGKSAEHEVSLQSAKNIIEAIDRQKYDVLLIGIDRQGRWHLNESSRFLLKADDPAHIHLKKSRIGLALIPGASSRQIVTLLKTDPVDTPDVIFPVLHGPCGEDGTVQGFLKLANIPFVGADVLSSAVCMDKVMMKRLLKEAGLPQARFLSYRSHQREHIEYEQVLKSVGLPFFVKPANLGSSVGINKVHGQEEFDSALDQSFDYDDKIIIEEYIKGREIECAVLGNEKAVASVPGEVVPTHEFYSYQAKYLDEHGADLIIPADLPESIIDRIQKMAMQAFHAVDCEGMARVDFFVSGERIYINELNTIPGFTRISMYPKLWEASGISYSELVDRLIELAIERFEDKQQSQTDFDVSTAE